MIDMERMDPPWKVCDFSTFYRDRDLFHHSGRRAIRRHQTVPLLNGKLLAKSLEARGFLRDRYFWYGPGGIKIPVSDVQGIDHDHMKSPGNIIRDLLTAIDLGIVIYIGYDQLNDCYTIENGED